jgi:hypothetical protein
MLIEILLAASIQAGWPAAGSPTGAAQEPVTPPAQTAPQKKEEASTNVLETDDQLIVRFQAGPGIVLAKAPHGLMSTHLAGYRVDETLGGVRRRFSTSKVLQPSRVEAWRLKGETLEIDLEIQVKPGPRTFRETYRTVTVGAIVGVERRVNQVLPPDFERPRRMTHRVVVLDPAAVDRKRGDQVELAYYGHSTVSQAGITYVITSHPLDDGRVLWRYRSCFSLLSQAMNEWLDPAIREIVLVSPKGDDALDVRDIIAAFVTHQPDIDCLARATDLRQTPAWSPASLKKNRDDH